MVHTIFSKKVIISTLIVATCIALGAIAPFYSHVADAKILKKNVNLSCMQTAVDTREDAIAEAFGTFNDDVEEALATRKSALHDAWGLESGSERTSAIKSAWTAWKSSHKNAFSELKSERKSAWATFKTTVKTSCKETLPKEENLTKDSAGSVAL